MARNVNIDILRFVCALLVVHLHSIKFTTRVGAWAWLCVEVFFMITGYLMLSSILNKKPRTTAEFMKAKIKTYLPYLIAAELISITAYCVVYTDLHGWGFSEYFFAYSQSVWEVLGLQMIGYPAWCGTGTAWYISSMIFSLAIIYPVLKKWPEFATVGAPVVSVMIYGYLYYAYGTICVIDTWVGFVTAGLLRGIAGICLGTFVYVCADRLRKVKLTRAGTNLLTFVEVYIFASVFLSMVFIDADTKNFFNGYELTILTLLWIGLIITFSEVSRTHIRTENFLVQRISSALGTGSLILYLNHNYVYFIVGMLYPDMDPTMQIMYSAVFIVVACILCYVVTKLLVRLARVVRDVLIEPSSEFVQ